jgi:hypothetical protein
MFCGGSIWMVLPACIRCRAAIREADVEFPAGGALSLSFDRSDIAKNLTARPNATSATQNP